MGRGCLVVVQLISPFTIVVELELVAEIELLEMVDIFKTCSARNMVDIVDKSLEIVDVGHEVHNQSQYKSAGPWVGRAQLSFNIKRFISSRKKIPVPQKIESPIKINFEELLDQDGVDISYVGYGPSRNNLPDTVSNAWNFQREGCMHDHRSLRVSYVVNFRLLRDVLDVGKGSGQVFRSHILPGELPELSLRVFVVDIFFAMPIPSGVAQPDIVPRVGQYECWRLIFTIQNGKIG